MASKELSTFLRVSKELSSFLWWVKMLGELHKVIS